MKEDVNHKDEDKTNNCVDNLEWCTQAYNNAYGTARQRGALAQSLPVNQYSAKGDFIRRWQSSEEVERNNIANATNVRKCCIGKLKTAGKFLWEYADNDGTYPTVQDAMQITNGNGKRILQYDDSGNLIASYPSLQEAMRQTGINSVGIGYCARGHKKHPHAGGYVWRYAEK